MRSDMPINMWNSTIICYDQAMDLKTLFVDSTITSKSSNVNGYFFTFCQIGIFINL